MATTKDGEVETIVIKVGYKGYAKLTYEDGTIIRVDPDQWQALQIARAKCRAEYGNAVEAIWYYEQIMALRKVLPPWQSLTQPNGHSA